MGLTAGLCEESARAIGYALLRRFRGFGDGLMLGLGHGGIEAMVLGGVLTASTLSSLAALQGADLNALNLSPEQLALLTRQMQVFSISPLYAASPFLERLTAMLLHVALSMLVWQAFNRRNAGYFLLAVGYHAGVDAAAVYLGQHTDSLGIMFAAYAVMLLPGLIWLWRIWPRGDARPAHPVTPVSAEWAAFVAATRKELLQQWRTKRVLVVGAVFVLFGLMSPVLAKFTPELLRAIPGAEQFAALVPKPTAADAMTQYVKNLTQFGFILAVLLGMGAVAGEKERGTAALILSKPMPRWAFVVSKFVAQTIVYVLGFAIASVGAYYYTVILFGQISFGSFIFANLLLLLWLLTFVAVSLLGSVLANSTGAAAGIGLGGSVLLMLSGSIPRVGPLAPGGLVAWASQVGMGTVDTPVASNGGAAAMALVIVLMCLIASVAAFETQEL
jgi:ABC-2 type transport system permease protein